MPANRIGKCGQSCFVRCLEAGQMLACMLLGQSRISHGRHRVGGRGYGCVCKPLPCNKSVLRSWILQKALCMGL